jgi:DNA-binding response OmpR family regulator
VRVLIAEDDHTFCEFLKETLELKGIEVVSSADGFEGHRKALSGDFDFFVLDVRMPGLSGTDLARLLKQNDPDAKIVLISAFAEPALRDTASNLGAPLLSKPFSADELLRLLEPAADNGGRVNDRDCRSCVT